MDYRQQTLDRIVELLSEHGISTDKTAVNNGDFGDIGLLDRKPNEITPEVLVTAIEQRLDNAPGEHYNPYSRMEYDPPFALTRGADEATRLQRERMKELGLRAGTKAYKASLEANQPVLDLLAAHHNLYYAREDLGHLRSELRGAVKTRNDLAEICSRQRTRIAAARALGSTNPKLDDHSTFWNRQEVIAANQVNRVLYHIRVRTLEVEELISQIEGRPRPTRDSWDTSTLKDLWYICMLIEGKKPVWRAVWGKRVLEAEFPDIVLFLHRSGSGWMVSEGKTGSTTLRGTRASRDAAIEEAKLRVPTHKAYGSGWDDLIKEMSDKYLGGEMSPRFRAP